MSQLQPPSSIHNQKQSRASAEESIIFDKCPYCYEPIDERATACPHCGQKLEQIIHTSKKNVKGARRLAFFEGLHILSSLAIIAAIVGWVLGIEERRVESQLQSWQIIASAKEVGSTAALSSALERLNCSQRNLFCQKVQLDEINLTDALLASIDLSNASLTYADLTNANLMGADLTNANLMGADLTNAHLFGADLTDADLYNVNLTNAHLLDANLTNAHLFGADLTDADLYNADLTDAFLWGADLINADLSGASLNGAYYDDDTVFPDEFDPDEHGMQFQSWEEWLNDKNK